jgi:hypothetical protein
MTDVQTNRLNSLLKSDTVLTENQVELSSVSQIAPLATELKNTILAIEDAAADGTLDLSGVTKNKSEKRKQLETTMLKVGRGASAYFKSIDNIEHIAIVDFTTTELLLKKDNDLYIASKQLYELAEPNKNDLIGADASDVAQLDVEKEYFFSKLTAPKNAIELSANHNKLIDPLLRKGMQIREDLDIYLQTFIATNPLLYGVWKSSLSIDDTGANAPIAYSVDVIVASNSVLKIDYTSVALQANTEIKMKNTSDGEMAFGFGGDIITFAHTEVVPPKSQKRLTASILGYDVLNSLLLMVQNNNAVPLSATFEFYMMD